MGKLFGGSSYVVNEWEQGCQRIVRKMKVLFWRKVKMILRKRERERNKCIRVHEGEEWNSSEE